MNSKISKATVSSRKFISTSYAALVGLTVVPSHVVSGRGHPAPKDKMNIAGIGISGMGRVDLEDISATENIVALCDVDWSRSDERVFNTYPQASDIRISGL